MTKLFPYQAECVEQMKTRNGRILLGLDMGLGKSIIALKYCVDLKIRPIVIICPASLKYNWEHEAATHFGLLCDILHGQKAKKRSLTNYHNPIIIINYEILQYWIEYLVSIKPQAIIWDEAHYCKSRFTLRFKALKELLRRVKPKHRIALSGTPITNRPAELWTTLHLLLPNLYDNFFEFGFRYCNPKMKFGRWEFTGKKNLTELHNKLTKSVMIRKLKKDALKDLPEKVRSTIYVKLSKEDRAEYDFCAHHFLKWIALRKPNKLHRVKKSVPLSRLGYLMRLAMKLKRFDVLEWIQNFHEESEAKLIVFSCHTKMIDWLHSKFKDISVVINGEVTGKKRHQAVMSFQKDKHIRYAFCNPKAAGVGLTLTAAADQLWADLPYSPGEVVQGEDRIHRIGATKKCSIYYMVAGGTVEEYLCSLIIDKQSTLDEVLDGRKGGREFDVFEELLKLTNEKTKN